MKTGTCGSLLPLPPKKVGSFSFEPPSLVGANYLLPQPHVSYFYMNFLLAPLQISNKSHQIARNNFWNQKNLELFAKHKKGQKWKKSWDRKTVHRQPQFWKGKPEEREVIAHG